MIVYFLLQLAVTCILYDAKIVKKIRKRLLFLQNRRFVLNYLKESAIISRKEIMQTTSSIA